MEYAMILKLQICLVPSDMYMAQPVVGAKVYKFYFSTSM